MGLRTENKEKRRQRILAAAQGLIDRAGIDAWSMRKVARAAGVSVTTLYNLFGSKDEIRSALVGGFFDELDRDVEQTPIERPLERARAVVTVGVDHVVAEAAMTRSSLLAAEQGPADEDPATPLAVSMQRVALQAAMDRGLLRDDMRADLLAAQVYAGFHRAALGWARGELDPAGFKNRALYALTVCLLAAATEKTRAELVRTLHTLERKLARRARKAA
jgi:AcrR family transcriptional regulator